MSRSDHGQDDLREMERQFILDARAMVQESAGVIAMQDRFLRNGLVRSGPPCRVMVTRVRADDSPLEDSYGLLPEFRFVITADGEGRDELHSFLIDSEIAIDALSKAHPSRAHLRVPAPVFEIERVVGERLDVGVVGRGALRYLTIDVVELADPPPEVVAAGKGPGTGIRFAVADETHEPLYSFAMNWPLAFMILGTAWEEGFGGF